MQHNGGAVDAYEPVIMEMPWICQAQALEYEEMQCDSDCEQEQRRSGNVVSAEHESHGDGVRGLVSSSFPDSYSAAL